MAHSIDASLVLPVIGRIYDAALDVSVWVDVISGIAALHGSDKAVLFTPLHAANQGDCLSAGISETMIQQRAVEYGQYDVWMQATQRKDYPFSPRQGRYRRGFVSTWGYYAKQYSHPIRLSFSLITVASNNDITKKKGNYHEKYNFSVICCSHIDIRR